MVIVNSIWTKYDMYVIAFAISIYLRIRMVQFYTTKLLNSIEHGLERLVRLIKAYRCLNDDAMYRKFIETRQNCMKFFPQTFHHFLDVKFVI